MDPLSVLSLSCNVLDLITAAGKTCAFLYDVHKAGTFPTHQEVVSTTTLLEKSAQALTQELSDANNPRQPRRADDKELLDIAQKARKLASDLQKKLEALQVLPADSRAKRFEKLLKTVLQKGKIYDLQRRWAELSKAVDSALLMRLTVESEKGTASTNSQLRDLAQQIRQGLSRLNDIDQEMKKQNDMTRVAVTTEAQLTRDNVAAQAETSRRHTTQEATTSRGVSKSEADKTRQHITAENAASRKILSKEVQATHLSVVGLSRRMHTAHKKTQSCIEKKLAFQQRQDLDERKTSRFINSFRFPELNERRNQITEPHSETYGWIFEDGPGSPWDSFSDWLRSSAGMYWIHGKAGSGKSTLMHFISEHHKTRNLLNQWSSPHPTKIISWYFWNSGSQIQRSLKGALCALLYQLLSQQSDVVLDLLGRDSHSDHPQSPADWPQAKLISLSHKIFSLIPGYVVIFLDGLDEFDREEDVLVLLNLLRSLTKVYKVKVCLSSRPERRMELQLGQLPQLRLQDMTADDIYQYVDDTLRQVFPHWDGRQFERFGGEIARKADGVFLWVYVVLKSLQQGSSHSDDYTVLRERLELLPAKMESLYEHMWLSLNGDGDLPTYRKQAALFFNFHDHFPLDLLDFILATDEDLCAMASSTTQADTVLELLYEKSTQMNTLLQTRCAGLLEIVSDPASEDVDDEEHVDDEEEPRDVELSSTEPATELSTALKNLGRVQFFHRTARDFLLDKPAGQEILKSYQLSKQDVVERLLKARLASRICGIHHPSGLEHTKTRWTEYNAITSAINLIGALDSSGADEHVANAQYRLLQLVESTYQKTLIPMWDGFIDQSCKRNWFLRVCYGPASPEFWGEVMHHIQSSALTTRILRTGPQDKNFATYLLCELCKAEWLPQYNFFNEAHLRSVQRLLEAGADPNMTDIFHSRNSCQASLWQRFMMSIMNLNPARSDDFDMAILALLTKTVKCFLHNGGSMSEKALVLRNKDARRQIVLSSELDIFEKFRTYQGRLEPDSVISTVNGVYLLHQLDLVFPRGWRENNLEDVAGITNLMPSCHNLAVVGHDYKIYRLWRDDPDPLECPLHLDAGNNGDRGDDSITPRLDQQYPQLFSKDRQVQLKTVLQEQASAAIPEIAFERRDSWIENLEWSCRHIRAREVLSQIGILCAVEGHYQTLRGIQTSLLQLSIFRDQFGLLTKSTLPREELDVVEKSSWPKVCSRYDSYLHDVNCGCEGDPRYPLKEFDAEFQDLAGLLNSHGFKKLAFQGKHIALDDEGVRIPWCSEKPAVCDSSHTDRYDSFWGFWGF